MLWGLKNIWEKKRILKIVEIAETLKNNSILQRHKTTCKTFKKTSNALRMFGMWSWGSLAVVLSMHCKLSWSRFEVVMMSLMSTPELIFLIEVQTCQVFWWLDQLEMRLTTQSCLWSIWRMWCPRCPQRQIEQSE